MARGDEGSRVTGGFGNEMIETELVGSPGKMKEVSPQGWGWDIKHNPTCIPLGDVGVQGCPMALGRDIPRALGSAAGRQHPRFQNYITGRLVGCFPSECVSWLQRPAHVPQTFPVCCSEGLRTTASPPAVPPDPSRQGTHR